MIRYYLSVILSHRWLNRIMPSALYLKAYYYKAFRKPLHLDNPLTFNEKMQWLKLNCKNPEYSRLVDKVSVKDFVAERVGEKYVIPTYGVWNSTDDIDYASLPDKFVIKCSHDSGTVILCRDKSALDIDATNKALASGLKRNYYYFCREYPYKDIKPRIIAEEYLTDESGYELKDYKFFCFDGKVKYMKIDYDRSSNHCANYYDADFNDLPIYEVALCPEHRKKLPKPDNFEEMISIAERLARGFVFVRVDLYNSNRAIKFGEMTFFPGSGFYAFTPEWADRHIGNMLRLPARPI